MSNRDVFATLATPSTINELIAGSFGGAAQVLVGQPLDTIKTRAQIAPKGMFKGPMDILVKTVRKEGILALYKGMLSPLLGIAGVNSLLFTSYATSKRLISPFPDLSLKQIAGAGAIAGLCNSILASPVELFKIRMQAQYGSATDKRLSAVFREMYSTYGFRKGVMRGYWVTVLREIPAYAAFYSTYEFVKRKFISAYGSPSQVPVWALLTSGSCGGVAYWLACYPIDVIKSRVQLADKPPPSGGTFYIRREFQAVIRESGWGGLVRGLSPCLIRSIPAAAATFGAYEISREFLRKETGV